MIRLDPKREARLNRVVVKLLDDLPKDLPDAFVVAAKLYHYVKLALEEELGQGVEYLMTKKGDHDVKD